MRNEENFLTDIFNEAFEDTRKHFSEVFKLDRSNGETKLTPLIPSKIGDHNLDQDRIIIEPLKTKWRITSKSLQQNISWKDTQIQWSL